MITQSSQEVEGKNVPSLAALPTSVGSTVAASMQSKMQDVYPQISVEGCVLRSLELVCSGLVGILPTTKLLVESLIWCFLARLSVSEKMSKNHKEYGRFISSMRVTACRIIETQTVDFREQSYVKYWIDTYLAMGFLDSQRPVREPWNTKNLFSGWLKRFVCRAVARRDLSFLFSLQKGSKQMWAPLGDENVRKAIDKSISRLCTPRGYIPEYNNARGSVSDSIRNISDRVFVPGKYDQNVGSRFMPSGSACLQASLKEGGALSLFDELTIPEGFDKPLSIGHPSGVIGKVPRLLTEVNKWRQDTFMYAIDNVCSRAYDVDDDVFHTFDTRFVSIFEPGKIRNISVSDGYLATALQPLQGFMLDSWKKTTWSTMLDGDLTKRVREMDINVKEELWCSGDYEAATDLLFREATIACFNSLSWHPLYPVGYMSLTHGRMVYPDRQTLKFTNKKGEFIGKKLQMYEGQLMGHTLSFPMLCVINVGVLRRSLDLWVEEALTHPDEVDRARRAHLILRYALINGDDILFKGPRELFSIFQKVARSVGFVVSQGKNYISPDTCLINSQLYLRVDGKMTRKGYLNLRLIKGNNIKARFAGGENPVTPDMIGKDLSFMAKLCPWTASAIPAAFHRWDKDWLGMAFQPNWYLPVSLGGYGVDIDLAPPGWRITRQQRIVAAAYVANPELSLYRVLGGNKIALRFTSLMMKPYNVPGSYVPLQNERLVDSSADDPWIARMAYISRALNPSRVRNDANYIANYLKREFRLKPMSADGLIKYFNCRLFYLELSPCPPIGEIRYSVIPRIVFF